MCRLCNWKGQAEECAEKHSNGRKSTESVFRYGFVLIDFLKFKLGACDLNDLQKTLVQALLCNSFVPSLLLGDSPLRDRPKGRFSSGDGSLLEAMRIVLDVKDVWKRTPGILGWLRNQQRLGGRKPKDDGSILFSLLQKGKVLVDKRNPNHRLELTTRVGLIPSRSKPDFYLPPGMKEHSPDRIVTYKSGEPGEFISFSYKDVVNIHFWKLLNESEAFGEDDEDLPCSVCSKPASFRCSACLVTWYCSQACQKKDWKGKGGASSPPPHKVQCRKLVKN